MRSTDLNVGECYITRILYWEENVVILKLHASNSISTKNFPCQDLVYAHVQKKNSILVESMYLLVRYNLTRCCNASVNREAHFHRKQCLCLLCTWCKELLAIQVIVFLTLTPHSRDASQR